jgi:hypothetical protein
MSKETFHEALLKTEKDIKEREKVLDAIKQTLTEYGTSPQGAAVFETESRELSMKKWVFDILTNADSLWEERKPPVKTKDAFE